MRKLLLIASVVAATAVPSASAYEVDPGVPYYCGPENAYQVVFAYGRWYRCSNIGGSWNWV